LTRVTISDLDNSRNRNAEFLQLQSSTKQKSIQYDTSNSVALFS